MRNRTIPVIQKVATSVQTDVNLVHDPIFYSTEEILTGSRVYQGLRQSHIMGPDGVIRTESDNLLLSHIRNQLQLFKGLTTLQGMSQQDLRKRLQWLQSQIEGLEKRQLTLVGLNGELAGYYKVISDLQGKLDKQLVISNNYQPKVLQLSARITELEAQITLLRKANHKEQEVKEENDRLKEAYRQITDVVRDPKRMRDIEKTVNTVLVPILDDLDFKLDAMIKSSTVVGRATSTPQNKLKSQVNSLLKNIDRLLKAGQEFTIEHVQHTIQGFLKDLSVANDYQDYAQGRLYKHMYEELKEKFAAVGGLFKTSFEKAIRDHPDLKNKIDISQVEVLMQEQGVDVVSFGNVMIAGSVWGSGRTVYYQTLEQRTKGILKLMTIHFKKLLKKYPSLSSELSVQLQQILTLEVFDEATALEQIQRIVQVVKFQPEIIKVENVYNLDSEKNRKAIFHLKIMVKVLLEELLKLKDKTGAVLEIDEGFIGMIRAQILDLVDPEDVLRVFRSIPKIVQVQKVVEKDLGRYLGVLTQAHPLNVQSAKIVDRIVEKPVIVKDQVSLIVEKGVTEPSIVQKPVYLAQERIVQVPVTRQVVVERAVTNQVAVEHEVTQQVPLIQTQFQEVERIVYQEKIVEVPRDVTTEVPFQTSKVIKEIVEVPRYQERLVEVLRDITNIKEVRLAEQVPVEMVKYIELEKIVNNFIKVPQIVEIKQQVPITITNTIEKAVDVIETIEKIIVTNTIEERLVEVPTIREVPIIQEVPVNVVQQIIVVSKGDREEVLVEVERITEKPLIRQVIQLKEVEVEKAIPVWMREQKPVIIQVKTPYIQNQPEIITLQVQKFIPYREQVPVEVIREVPVPIVLEKQVVKQVRVQVQKIVEKLVEVPRVVEVEKIVEKIVVVPRVIQNIVHVPQIVEKIVDRQVEVLKIVEVEKPVPIYLNQQVKQIVTEKVPYPVQKRTYEIVEKEIVTTLTKQTEVIKEVAVEVRVPVEVIRQKEVPFIKEKIVEKLVTIHDVEIRDREVVVPFKQQVPVELIQQRAVEVRKIIENPIQVTQVIEKPVTLYQIRTVPQIHQVIVQKPIEIDRQVVYTDTRNFIQHEIEYKQLIKEVLVKETEKIEILKPQPYIVQKIIITNQIHEQGVEVKLEKGAPYRSDQVVAVEKPVNYYAVKEVPHQIFRDKLVEVRTFIDNIKTVEVAGPQKVVVLNQIKPEVVEVKEQVVKFLKEQVEKRVVTEVPVKEIVNQVVEVPGKSILVHETQEIRTNTTEPVYAEKVVERVILLPQIIQILKHVHDIAEVQQMGIAVGVDIDIHKRNYIDICRTLKGSLEGLIIQLRGLRGVDSKAQIQLIQELLALLTELIKFPTIVQVPKQVIKTVEVQKIVLVPTKDQQAIDRQLSTATLIEKLVEELKRVRRTFNIDLQLDDEIKNIFFAELRDIEQIDVKLQQFTKVVLERFRALGGWTEQHSLMLNSFLQERFLMAGIIRECNDSIENVKTELDRETIANQRLNDVITKLNIHNISLKNTLEEIVKGLGVASVEEAETSAVKRILEGLINRGRSSLQASVSDPLRESRYVQERMQSFAPTAQTEKLRSTLRLMESEIESYKGGQSQRNRYLGTEMARVRAQNEALKEQIQRLRQTQKGPDRIAVDRKNLEHERKIDQLNRQLNAQKQDFERRLKRSKEDFDKQVQSRIVESRLVSPNKEQERLRAANRDLEGRIIQLQEQLTQLSNQKERIRSDGTRKQLEIDELRRKVGLSGISEFEPVPTSVLPRGGGGTNPSNIPATRLPQSQRTPRQPITRDPRESRESGGEVRQTPRQPTRLGEKPNEGTTKAQGQQSPEVLRRGQYTPAEQLQFQSPEVREVRTQQQPSEVQSVSSRLSGGEHLYASQRRTPNVPRNVTIAALIAQGSLNENIVAILIIKIIEKIQEDIAKGRYLMYTPENIHILGYTPEHPDRVRIRLENPINPQGEAGRLYLTPEVLSGGTPDQKSCVFNIGLIWDEMLHGERFFRTADQVESLAYEYRVRNNRINPIFKNTLFEMLSKETKRRLKFNEIRRRLTLQNFILTEDNR